MERLPVSAVMLGVVLFCGCHSSSQTVRRARDASAAVVDRTGSPAASRSAPSRTADTVQAGGKSTQRVAQTAAPPSRWSRLLGIGKPQRISLPRNDAHVENASAEGGVSNEKLAEDF